VVIPLDNINEVAFVDEIVPIVCVPLPPLNTPPTFIHILYVDVVMPLPKLQVEALQVKVPDTEIDPEQTKSLSTESHNTRTPVAAIVKSVMVWS
jgi:hypothetical protein